jgi:hypothetical protein
MARGRTATAAQRANVEHVVGRVHRALQETRALTARSDLFSRLKRLELSRSRPTSRRYRRTRLERSRYALRRSILDSKLSIPPPPTAPGSAAAKHAGSSRDRHSARRGPAPPRAPVLIRRGDRANRRGAHGRSPRARSVACAGSCQLGKRLILPEVNEVTLPVYGHSRLSRESSRSFDFRSSKRETTRWRTMSPFEASDAPAERNTCTPRSGSPQP